MSHALPFLRIEAKHDRQVVLLSHYSPLATHFIGRRLLCVGDNCPACDYDEPRTFCYALGRCLGNGKLGLLELPANTFSTLQKSLMLDASVFGPGSILLLRRKHTKAPVFGDWIEQTHTVPLSGGLTLARVVLASFGIGTCHEGATLREAVATNRGKVMRHLVDALRNFGYSTD